MTFADINNGTYDAYITKSADEMKQFGTTVFLRPFHEFNGNWYPWGLANQGADSAADTAFINAWRHIYAIFQQQGATNVKFVWCYQNFSVPNTASAPWNDPSKAYPGDAYVDWIAFDAFNLGSSTNGRPWQSFDTIVRPAYELAVSISPSKPVMIAEIASNEYGDGGNKKAAWVSQMLSELASPSNPYPNLRLISWFEGDPNGYLYNSESTQPVYSAWVNGIRTVSPSGILDFRSNATVLDNLTSP
ncbi:MAG: glycoside hydrolase family 26 protein [Vulcanimicrobiaceae bacterium]